MGKAMGFLRTAAARRRAPWDSTANVVMAVHMGTNLLLRCSYRRRCAKHDRRCVGIGGCPRG